MTTVIRLLPFVLYVALAAYCISDALQHPDQHPHSLPKWAWVLIILLFPYIGAAAWLFLKFSNGGGSRRQPEPLAPDDDPEYLAWLRDQERRRRGREGRREG